MFGHQRAVVDSCMLSAWPEHDESLCFPEEDRQAQGIMDIIRAVRNLRAELKVQPGHKARLLLKPQIGWEDALKEASAHFMRLASASSVEFLKEGQTPEGKLVSAVTGGAELFIPLGDLVDLDKEAQRLQKEYDNLTGEIARAQGRLNNPGFLSKAPEALVLQDKQKLEDNIAMQQTLKQRLSDLRN